jgi:manganese transport protein
MAVIVASPPQARAGRPSARPRVSASGCLRTLGPALLVAAGYVDPGNWGTDVAAGAQFGYRLLWVLACATAAALFLQHLAARLGFISGQDLASLMRAHLPRRVRTAIIPAMLATLAVTEIVEVLGVVIGMQMLTGWQAGPCVLIATGLVLLLLLAPGDVGRRATYGCLTLVAIVYLSVLVVHGADGALAGMVPHRIPAGGLPVAVGLIGAIVMPHNILLHSALARDVLVETVRHHQDEPQPQLIARLQHTSLITTGVALVVALAINSAIVSVSAHPGSSSELIAGLHTASPTFGAATSTLFAITLIGAGLASSMTGGMVSADALRRLAPGLRLTGVTRRIVSLLPAAAVAASGVSEISVLVWSQVVLALALPLVLVPLIWFNTRHDLVGPSTLGRPARLAAWTIVLILCAAGAMSLAAR